jgi:hypothetical protein
MFYEIPQVRTGMSAAELRTHLIAARQSLLAAMRSDDAPSDEDATAYRIDIKALATEVDDQTEVEKDEAAASAATPPTTASDTEPEPDGDEPDEPDEPEAEASAPQTVAAPPAVIRTSVELEASEAPVESLGIQIDKILTTNSRPGMKVGDPFASWGDFGMAALERAKALNPGSGEKFEVGMVRGNYPAERVLTDSAFDNLRKLDTLSSFNRSTEEITASLCAPATPYYGMACLNTTRRPVAASLNGFQAPRGKVSIYPSPSLSAVAGSAGIWTAANDANVGATKNACARITCATPTEYTMYGVYWCLTVKNMELLTFPELVAAYLNRGAANYARLGERQLLDAMASGVGSVTTLDLGPISATQRVGTQLLQYLAMYREQQRWDDVPMQAWAPRWFRDALRVDISRRRNTNGQFQIATEADVNRVFADAGFDMTWYLDTPTWGTVVPNLTSNANLSAGATGVLSAFPQTAEVLVAPVGKFTMIDRAQLSIGVTGNNWYRDNTSNSKNEVTYFFENYEGVVDTTSCPAHLVKFDTLCYAGNMTADRAVACTGVAT